EPEVVQSGRVELACNDPFHDPPDRPPADPEHLRDFRPVCDLGEVRSHLLKLPGEAALGRSPGDLLCQDAAVRTLDPTRRVGKPDDEPAKRQVSPVAKLPGVVTGSDPAAATTTCLLPTRPYVKD